MIMAQVYRSHYNFLHNLLISNRKYSKLCGGILKNQGATVHGKSKKIYEKGDPENCEEGG